MAIEIVSKKEKREFSLTKFLLWIMGVFLVVGGASYFFIDYQNNSLSAELEEINKQLIKTPEQKALEKKVFETQDFLDDFKYVFQKHRFPLNLFTFLEVNVHPRVLFSEFKYNQSSSSINVIGKTQNFHTLGQQILILRDHALVRNVKISKVLINNEGEIVFTLVIGFDSKIFSLK